MTRYKMNNKTINKFNNYFYIPIDINNCIMVELIYK